MAVAVDNGPSVYTQLKQGVNEIQSDERIRKSLWHHAYTATAASFSSKVTKSALISTPKAKPR